MTKQQTSPTHPLMPGIRCHEINNPDWPRTLHDKQLTGFSPLTLGMSTTPEIWQRLTLAGEYRWVKTVSTVAGPQFLIDDGHLSLYDVASAQRHWRTAISGHLVFWGDLYGDGTVVALVQHANRLAVVDGQSGHLRWSQKYLPAHVELRVQVARILPTSGGYQAAVFEQYGAYGWLLDFTPNGDVQQVWHQQVIANDPWPVRADHGCDIAFDLSGEIPLIWNVRHHRCQSFNALSGTLLGSVQYELEHQQRRNYGPWQLATGAHNKRFIVVAGEMVQTHVHALLLHPDGTPELAWQRYYGEVYVVPGVAVQYLAVADLDGDGIDEIAYNVRDPEYDFRSFVRVRDVASGQIKYEWADQWCSALVKDVGLTRRSIFMIHPAPNGMTPEQGPLTLASLESHTPQVLATFDYGGPWGIALIPGLNANDLLVRCIDAQNTTTINRLDGTTLKIVESSTPGPLPTSPPDAWAQVGQQLYLASSAGTCRWPDGKTTAFDVHGGAPPTLSGAVTNNSNTSTLFAHIPGHRIKSWHLNQAIPQELFTRSFIGETARHSPLLYDVDNDGQLEVVIPGVTAHGQLEVTAIRPDNTVLWRTVLPQARSDDNGKIIAWNAGHFLADGPRAALAITVYSDRRIQEGTYLLEGANGRICWFRGNYYDGDNIRAYRPVGLPGAFDWDNDGVEEIVWDMYSYMAFVRGDGDMAAIYGGENVRPAAAAVPAILLYNGFTPIYRTASDPQPHWLVHHGHGRFGLVGPDPRQGLWHEDEGYDTPERIGFIDVDGDGVLEVGYALTNSTTFCCRDIWTGQVKWSLDLPEAPNGPVITADVDGDGKGEFLVDRWCVGTNDAGLGEIRWTAPVPLGWAIIADFDGDGLGEIACSNQGQIVVLKARV